MTVRSKQIAARSANASRDDKVVHLPATRSSSAGVSVSLHSRAKQKTSAVPNGAELLSIRQHLAYVASIGIVDLEFIEQSYSSTVANTLLIKVRNLLHLEFGPLRVHRRRQVFVVSHHCMETLIAGLFRVQYHSHEIPLPATRDGNGLSDVCGVPLTWGAGKTILEAEAERHKKSKES